MQKTNIFEFEGKFDLIYSLKLAIVLNKLSPYYLTITHNHTQKQKKYLRRAAQSRTEMSLFLSTLSVLFIQTRAFFSREIAMSNHQVHV